MGPVVFIKGAGSRGGLRGGLVALLGVGEATCGAAGRKLGSAGCPSGSGWWQRCGKLGRGVECQELERSLKVTR